MTEASAVAKRMKQRALERALREERTAITALAKIVLLECEDPARALARIDAMVRVAEGGQRLAPGARQALIDAARFMHRAAERELRPFDPPTPEPNMHTVSQLVKGATEDPQQLGLLDNASSISDVERAHEERVDTLTVVHRALLDILRDNDALTEKQMWGIYAVRDHGAPHQSTNSLVQRRKELKSAGLIVRVGDVRGEALWSLAEGI